MASKRQGCGVRRDVKGISSHAEEAHVEKEEDITGQNGIRTGRRSTMRERHFREKYREE